MHETIITLTKNKEERVTLIVDNRYTDQNGTEHSHPHRQTSSVKVIEAVIAQSIDGLEQSIKAILPTLDATDEIIKAIEPILAKNDNNSAAFKATVEQYLHQAQQSAKQGKAQHDKAVDVLAQWRKVQEQLN